MRILSHRVNDTVNCKPRIYVGTLPPYLHGDARTALAAAQHVCSGHRIYPVTHQLEVYVVEKVGHAAYPFHLCIKARIFDVLHNVQHDIGTRYRYNLRGYL